MILRHCWETRGSLLSVGGSRWHASSIAIWAGTASRSALSAVEIEQFFGLTGAELGRVRARQTPLHRLAVALHIGFLKMTGRPLNSVEIVPEAVLAHLGRQLDETPAAARLDPRPLSPPADAVRPSGDGRRAARARADRHLRRALVDRLSPARGDDRLRARRAGRACPLLVGRPSLPLAERTPAPRAGRSPPAGIRTRASSRRSSARSMRIGERSWVARLSAPHAPSGMTVLEWLRAGPAGKGPRSSRTRSPRFAASGSSEQAPGAARAAAGRPRALCARDGEPQAGGSGPARRTAAHARDRLLPAPSAAAHDRHRARPDRPPHRRPVARRTRPCRGQGGGAAAALSSARGRARPARRGRRARCRRAQAAAARADRRTHPRAHAVADGGDAPRARARRPRPSTSCSRWRGRWTCRCPTVIR